ncbi:MAG TPA: hypothetical protein VHL31_20640 [Geminicoccus sp.]|jgi:hypothetical protein|uniref:hypothetical protein n=1 Tax=Geminicoccus sp. TaxID=2024832 RepID=UPI002E2FA44D|nr:hypothetical protein [Geminicoccus sp.]HEX2528689.1 hypothetical protein [Geminicoccus sp.]
MLYPHEFTDVAPGMPCVCLCPACSAGYFRTLARLSDASRAPPHVGRAARIYAELIERAGLAIALRQDPGASSAPTKEETDG